MTNSDQFNIFPEGFAADEVARLKAELAKTAKKTLGTDDAAKIDFSVELAMRITTLGMSIMDETKAWDERGDTVGFPAGGSRFLLMFTECLRAYCEVLGIYTPMEQERADIRQNLLASMVKKAVQSGDSLSLATLMSRLGSSSEAPKTAPGPAIVPPVPPTKAAGIPAPEVFRKSEDDPLRN